MNIEQSPKCNCNHSHDITFCLSLDCKRRLDCSRHLVNHSMDSYYSCSDFSCSSTGEIQDVENCLWFIERELERIGE